MSTKCCSQPDGPSCAFTSFPSSSYLLGPKIVRLTSKFKFHLMGPTDLYAGILILGTGDARGGGVVVISCRRSAVVEVAVCVKINILLSFEMEILLRGHTHMTSAEFLDFLTPPFPFSAFIFFYQTPPPPPPPDVQFCLTHLKS